MPHTTRSVQTAAAAGGCEDPLWGAASAALARAIDLGGAYDSPDDLADSDALERSLERMRRDYAGADAGSVGHRLAVLDRLEAATRSEGGRRDDPRLTRLAEDLAAARSRLDAKACARIERRARQAAEAPRRRALSLGDPAELARGGRS